MPATTSICLWFDSRAEDAAAFYVSLLDDARVIETATFPEGLPPEGAPRPTGTSVMSVTFELGGVEFMALNGGPLFSFTPATSIVLLWDTQEEVDWLWAALTDGGEESQCGWLVDRFGVSWQVVPRGLDEMIASSDAAAKRAVDAMLPMHKLDIRVIRAVYEGRG